MPFTFLQRPRFRLITLMIAIALITLGLWVPIWWRNGLNDTWNGPVAIKVTPTDTLEDALKRLKVATCGFRVKNGLPMYVDPVGLQESGIRLNISKITSDLDAKGLTVRQFLNRILQPLGLAAKLDSRYVTITSKESLDISLEP
jgi:hypothetical protein